jgi:hypothetical protein
MTPEEVARQHFTRPGFRLDSYGEVALPYWRLTVRAEILEKKPVAPLGEFALRAVGIGIDHPDAVGTLLGLDEPVLEATLVGLLADDDLAVAGGPAGGTQALTVTQKGRRTLEALGSIVPEEAILEIHYDGLLRRPVAFVDNWLEPRDVRSQGLREIPPARTRPPELDDLPIDAIQAVVRRLGDRRHALRDILALKMIDQRKRIFQPAVALVYRAETGDETRVEFAVDGRISPQHGEAFEHAGLKRKLGIGSDGLRSAEEIAREVFGPEVVKRAKTEEALQLQRVITTAEQQIVAAEESREGGAQAEVPAAAREELERAEKALEELDVRPIETFEHPTLLERALERSQERLVIVSPWIRRKVVNGKFLALLEDRLKAGVDVYIGWGMADDTRSTDADREPLEALEKLARRYPSFSFVWFGDTHAKILISDRKFAVAGSFNWLSFKGDPRRRFREERGLLVKDPRVVDAQFDAIIGRFGVDGEPPSQQ